MRNIAWFKDEIKHMLIFLFKNDHTCIKMLAFMVALLAVNGVKK